jgi:hypothetical protein
LKNDFINSTSIHFNYFPPPASSASAAPFAYSSGATFASAFATPATANNAVTIAFGTHCSLQFGTSNSGT